MSQEKVSNAQSEIMRPTDQLASEFARANGPVSGFLQRHIGLSDQDIRFMLDTLEETNLEGFVKRVVPESIQDFSPLDIATPLEESEALDLLAQHAGKNKILKSMIGQGYYGCHTPAVLQRNVFENPGWYTAYTPYQPEIAQGRLEVLFNFQTMITELTGMDIANASLLDEATAAAEAMAMAHRSFRGKRNTLLASSGCHPQTLDVLQTRALPLGISVQTFNPADEQLSDITEDCFAVLLQYPSTQGDVPRIAEVSAATKAKGAQLLVATDLLALTLLQPPSRFAADIVVGSAQRFGVPMGFGGPHAAFIATTDKLKRGIPGRLIGESVDSHGQPAYRLALQTREQHIRREKATSNICTAQALLAIMSTLYACYHGPQGLRQIALRSHAMAHEFRRLLLAGGLSCDGATLFDTVLIEHCDALEMQQKAQVAGFNICVCTPASVSVSFDETTTPADVLALADALLSAADAGDVGANNSPARVQDLQQRINELVRTGAAQTIAAEFLRDTHYLSQACFNTFQSETEMMRYLRRLADRDIALDRAMIPLGSCTMKLNAAAEMIPVSWPAFAALHPFAPAHQSAGYRQMISELEAMLCACTGYAAVSLQPNAGSQGEYAGLLAISRYHQSRNEAHRNICLIPESAHGTNPASAQMAGMQVVVVRCDDKGNVDLNDLTEKLSQHADTIAAIMITYPSTHGVFEKEVGEVCRRVHDAGGQVYIDGANLNALVGVARPGRFGGDVSHLNLHKTFCIPHGGGGPGVGPIGVAKHLAPFLPGHALLDNKDGVVSAAPWGSAMILPITWMYIRMMGAAGLSHATQVAILSANYIAKRLSSVYPILYTGENGYVAHECILDTRGFKEDAGISVDDIAKRLMDFGFHAPTMSFPVAGTLMIEPTESESLREIDRFCHAMLQIHSEIKSVAEGVLPGNDNPLVNAPHTARMVTASEWQHAYSREQAAYADGEATHDKYWPPVGRIDNVHGDKNLICSCPPLTDYLADSESVQSVDAKVAL